MAANLMGSTGVQQQLHKCCFAADPLACQGNFRQGGLSVQRTVYPPGTDRLRQIAANFCAITLFDFFMLEQQRQLRCGPTVVGHHYHAHRFPVEPMHQARPTAAEALLHLSQEADMISVMGALSQ